MKIESIRLKNYKVFRDVHLKDIPSFLVVVGANGSGKSTLFDVFGFLHDCLKGNVRQVLDSRGRFHEVLSRDALDDTILIEIQYRMLIAGVERLVTYSLEIGERAGAPFVPREIVRYKRGRYGSPFRFLDFTNGEGYAITNEEDFNKPDDELKREEQKVAPETLAIKGLGQFERFKAANAFRQLIESWHVSDFHISAARGRKEATGESEHLSETGENLPLVARYLFEQHSQAFQTILDTMAREDHLQAVLAELKKQLARDRTRTTVSGFTQLGLVEMTRKRTRESLAHMLCEPCPTCQGRGQVKTARSVCYDILREILREARQFSPREFRVIASATVVEMLLDEESVHLVGLSEFIGRPISLGVEATMNSEQYDIVLM